MNLAPLSLLTLIVFVTGSLPRVVADTTTQHRVAFATPPTPPAVAQNPASIKLYDTYVAETLARPLFSPRRRPDEAVKGSPSVAAVAGVPRLSGILVDGADRRAIFAGAEQGGRLQSIVAREGDAVGVYRVQSVTRDGVKLSGPDGEHVLKPSFSSAATNGMPGLQIPSNMVSIGSPRLDPNRFDAPVGAMGLAMYRYDPAAPHAPTPVSPALTAH